MNSSRELKPFIKTLQNLIIHARRIASKLDKKDIFSFLDEIEYLPVIITENWLTEGDFTFTLKEICQQYDCLNLYEKHIQMVNDSKDW